MEKYAPAYVVIDRQHDILRFSGGDVGRYLEPSPGAASLNLFNIVRKALRPAVRAALQRAEQAAETIATENATVKIDGESRSVKLIVEPLIDRPDAAPARWIVAFQETA